MADNDSIQSCDDIKSAVSEWDGKDREKQRYILKRAVDLGCVEHIPDDWGVEIDG